MVSEMNIFKCKHPFEFLQVAKDATETPIDEDFTKISYHFYCSKCNKEVTTSYAKMVGGVDAFIERGKTT